MQNLSNLHIAALVIAFLFAAGNLFVALLFHVVGLSSSIYKFFRRTTKQTKIIGELPGISIIKPLTDIDSNLEKNLETFFRLKYPRYEILFCIQDHNEQLLHLIERLQNRFPNIDSKIFLGSNLTNENIEKVEIDRDDVPLIDGSTKNSKRKKSFFLLKNLMICSRKKISISNEIKNPKIGNMMPAYENAQFPFILISDSGMMMREDALYDMYAFMDEKVGLVHQLPFTSDQKGFINSVEKVYFGTQQTRMYMALNSIGLNCVTGMSCLIRKQCLDKVGGLRAFGDFIAEDFYIAEAISKQGWKIRVCSSPALQNAGDPTFHRWINRMVRWSKLRIRLNPLTYFEPFQECFSTSILFGLLTNYFLDWNVLVVAACHILVWFILDYTLLRITQGGSLPFNKSEFAVAWLIRELTCYYIYFKAFTGSAVVQWRGKSYRLGWGTRAELIESSLNDKSMTNVPLLRIDSLPSTQNQLVNESAMLTV